MKKILIAFDGNHFSEGAFDFARRLNKHSSILLTGLFLPQIEFADYWNYASGDISGMAFMPTLREVNTEVTKENVDRFAALCERYNINYRTHLESEGFTLEQLKQESVFADLLILGSERFYENMGVEKINDFLKDTLHLVQCPVLIVPEKYAFPDTNILAYDGSATAVYAIKQFAYVLPEIGQNNTLLVHVSPEKGVGIPEHDRMEELADCHFPELTIQQLNMSHPKYFNAWLQERQNAIIVSGSFGRSELSSWFHKSFITEVVKDHRLPIFIAHK